MTAETEVKFTEAYLCYGNVSAAAREAGISTDAGYRLRNRLHADPEFVAMRDRIRAKIEPEVEMMLLSAAQEAHRRIFEESGFKLLERHEKFAIEHAGADGSARVNYNDPGPSYVSAFAKLAAQIQAGLREQRERDATKRPEGGISITFAPIERATTPDPTAN